MYSTVYTGLPPRFRGLYSSFLPSKNKFSFLQERIQLIPRAGHGTFTIANKNQTGRIFLQREAFQKPGIRKKNNQFAFRIINNNKNNHNWHVQTFTC